MATIQPAYGPKRELKVLHLTDLHVDKDEYQGLRRVEALYKNAAKEGIDLTLYGGDYPESTLSQKQLQLNQIAQSRILRIKQAAELIEPMDSLMTIFNLPQNIRTFTQETQNAIELYHALHQVSEDNAFEAFKKAYDVHNRYLPGVPIYAILGNHDPRELGNRIRGLKGVTFIEDKVYIPGLGVVGALHSSWAWPGDIGALDQSEGWGKKYEGTPAARPLTQEQHDLALKRAEKLKGVDYLLVHTPPYKIGDSNGQYGDQLPLLLLRQEKNLKGIWGGHDHEDFGIRLLSEDGQFVVNSASAGAGPNGLGLGSITQIDTLEKRLNSIQLDAIVPDKDGSLSHLTLQKYERGPDGKLVMKSPLTKRNETPKPIFIEEPISDSPKPRRQKPASQPIRPEPLLKQPQQIALTSPAFL